jgi:hypothetical protein
VLQYKETSDSVAANAKAIEQTLSLAKNIDRMMHAIGSPYLYMNIRMKCPSEKYSNACKQDDEDDRNSLIRSLKSSEGWPGSVGAEFQIKISIFKSRSDIDRYISEGVRFSKMLYNLSWNFHIDRNKINQNVNIMRIGTSFLYSIVNLQPDYIDNDGEISSTLDLEDVFILLEIPTFVLDEAEIIGMYTSLEDGRVVGYIQDGQIPGGEADTRYYLYRAKQP